LHIGSLISYETERLEDHWSFRLFIYL